MANLSLILVVFAFVCAAIAAFWIEATGRVNLGWASLAFYFLSLLVGGFR